MPFFTGLAQSSGCSDQEIKEALLAASNVARDSVYLNGLDYDINKFKKELQQISEHLQKQRKAA